MTDLAARRRRARLAVALQHLGPGHHGDHRVPHPESIIVERVSPGDAGLLELLALVVGLDPLLQEGVPIL